MQYSKQLYYFKDFVYLFFLGKNVSLNVFFKLNDISASFSLFKFFEF